MHPLMAGDITLFSIIANLTAPAPVAEGLCNGFTTRGSGGAAYTWCNRALKAIPPSVEGFSMGINSWDPWSKELNNGFGIPMNLYDCIYTKPLQGKHAEFKIPPKRFDTCIAGSNYVIEHENGPREFKEIHEVMPFDQFEKLSIVVKMDIEGSEWEVLQRLTKSDHTKIIFMDLEIHWCKGLTDGEYKNQPKERARVILRELIRLRQMYYITARDMSRSREWDLLEGKILTWADAGCDIYSQYDMMSISLVNKHVLLH
eukprot:m.244414 g.244414  ORF g.244414 m.244414 type:complete len:258 (-) comp16104_c1_seq9:5045-5818(-)